MFETLLVPTDGTEKAEVAVDWALELATEHGSTVHGLYVNNVSDIVPAASSPAPPEEISNAARREGENALRSLTSKAPENVEVLTELRNGNPAEQIVDYAAEHDVDAVVGRGGGQNFRRHLLEHLVGVVSALFPCLPVEHFKQHSCRRMPAPPEIVRQFPESAQAFGEVRKLDCFKRHGFDSFPKQDRCMKTLKATLFTRFYVRWDVPSTTGHKSCCSIILNVWMPVQMDFYREANFPVSRPKLRGL